MNKLAIPIALVGVIMVAGIFAFSPVQTASTVHETVSDGNTDLADLLCSVAGLTAFDGTDNCTTPIAEGGQLSAGG